MMPPAGAHGVGQGLGTWNPAITAFKLMTVTLHCRWTARMRIPAGRMRIGCGEPGYGKHMVATVDSVLNTCGQTYAEEAGIELADEPVPLYRLTLLTTLLSTRIQSRIAVATARELLRSGYGSPKRMLAASWQDRVDALGRGHYV